MSTRQGSRRSPRALLLLAVLVEVGGLLWALIGPPMPVSVRVGLGVLVGLVVVVEAGAWCRQWRAARSNGADRRSALRFATEAVVPAVALRAMRFELDSWVSLMRWARSGFRTPLSRDGQTVFSYHATVRPLILTMLVLSVAEVVAVELLLPWPTLRLVLLVLGVWAAVMVAGVLASLVVHPHTLDDVELCVRYGARIMVRVPLAAVESVRRVMRDHSGSTMQVVADEQRVSIGVGGQTNVSVHLSAPVAIESTGGESVQIRHVDFHADEPGTVATAVQTRRRQVI